jgi:hypothetical protein
MDSIRRVKDFGKVDYSGQGRKAYPVQIDLTITTKPGPARSVDLETIGEHKALSIMGGIWNTHRTDYVTGGQCVDTLQKYLGHNRKFRQIAEIWRRWHLNDMRAGTREQTAIVATMPPVVYPASHYEEACKLLDSRGLLIDRGYRYGSAWLVEPLPPEVEAEALNLFS